MDSGAVGTDDDLRMRIAAIEGELVRATDKDVSSAGIWAGFVYGLILPIVLLGWGYLAYVP